MSNRYNPPNLKGKQPLQYQRVATVGGGSQSVQTSQYRSTSPMRYPFQAVTIHGRPVLTGKVISQQPQPLQQMEYKAQLIKEQATKSPSKRSTITVCGKACKEKCDQAIGQCGRLMEHVSRVDSAVQSTAVVCCVCYSTLLSCLLIDYCYPFMG